MSVADDRFLEVRCDFKGSKYGCEEIPSVGRSGQESQGRRGGVERVKATVHGRQTKRYAPQGLSFEGMKMRTRAFDVGGKDVGWMSAEW